jgi:hypothetical protein
MLARTTPYAGFAAHHAGPYGYVWGHTFKSTGAGIVNAQMALDLAYPQAQLHRTDFSRGFPEWYCRLNPYRMRRYHGPYGDGGNYSDYNNAGHIGYRSVGEDMASVMRSGIAEQHYKINVPFHSPAPSPIPTEMIMRWHYRNRPPLETNTTSKVYVEDGYVAASSISPSLPDCYTNGVGFSMRARPRGSVGGHDTWTDGSLDMWAYGAQITDGGGAGLHNYDYRPESAPTLMVNGIGQYGVPPTHLDPPLPVQASICAFTNNGTNFVYTAAELSGLFTNGYHPLSNLVTKVKRHVLFPRSMYWVFYDEFSSKSNATFMWRWHVPWVFRYAPSGGAFPNEASFTGGRFGSNSLAMSTNGFTYVAGNYTDVNYNDTPPRVNVYVAFANATNQFGVFNATGTNSLFKDTANAIGTSATNSTLNPFINGGQTREAVHPDRAVGMWVTNRVASTNWHLMTVVVPQKPGVPPPVIQRIDDYTVAVTYDGVTETNTFGTSYSGPATYRVDLIATGDPLTKNVGKSLLRPPEPSAHD